MTDGGVTAEDKQWSGIGYVGAICCGIPALILFFVKPNVSAFVKYHWLQSFAFGILCLVISIGLNALSFMIPPAALLGLVVSPVLLLAWVALIIVGFTGKDFRIPGISSLIEPYAK